MDWKATLEEILAERRQRYGEHPSEDDLIALRGGTLADDQRQRLLEQASVDPEVAREMFDILRFPEASGDADDTSEDGDESPEENGVARYQQTQFRQTQRWQALRDRLVTEGDLPEKSVMSAVLPKRSAWLPIAAMLVLGVGTALLLLRVRDPGGVRPAAVARINLPIIELLPVAADTATDTAAVRGSAEVVTLDADAEGLVLALAVPGLAGSRAPAGDRGTYSLLLIHGDDTASNPDAMILDGLIPGVGGVFVLDLPRETWTDGLHTLRLRDSEGKWVARFHVTIALR